MSDTDQNICGFCGQDFETVPHKMAHQKKECTEIPRTQSEKPEKEDQRK